MYVSCVCSHCCAFVGKILKVTCNSKIFVTEYIELQLSNSLITVQLCVFVHVQHWYTLVCLHTHVYYMYTCIYLLYLGSCNSSFIVEQYMSAFYDTISSSWIIQSIFLHVTQYNRSNFHHHYFIYYSDVETKNYFAIRVPTACLCSLLKSGHLTKHGTVHA